MFENLKASEFVEKLRLLIDIFVAIFKITDNQQKPYSCGHLEG